MKNINGLFVPHKIAIKLKELGFNDECLGYYDDGTFVFWYGSEQDLDTPLNCTAPLYQQAIDWFEKKNIYIYVFKSYDVWQWKIDIDSSTDCFSTKDFHSKSEALDSAIEIGLKYFKKKL